MIDRQYLEYIRLFEFPKETRNPDAVTEDDLWELFFWLETEQGHEFWSHQAANGITPEGRRVLRELFAAAEEVGL